MAGYVNAVPAFVCFELPAREASSFCDFWKLTSCDFIAFLSSIIKVNFCFIAMYLFRINLPNLCPNMIHIDALDFSGWHSKQVISFFWRSVYLYYCLPIVDHYFPTRTWQTLVTNQTNNSTFPAMLFFHPGYSEWWLPGLQKKERKKRVTYYDYPSLAVADVSLP